MLPEPRVLCSLLLIYPPAAAQWGARAGGLWGGILIPQNSILRARPKNRLASPALLGTRGLRGQRFAPGAATAPVHIGAVAWSSSASSSSSSSSSGCGGVQRPASPPASVRFGSARCAPGESSSATCVQRVLESSPARGAVRFGSFGRGRFVRSGAVRGGRGAQQTPAVAGRPHLAQAWALPWACPPLTYPPGSAQRRARAGGLWGGILRPQNSIWRARPKNRLASQAFLPTRGRGPAVFAVRPWHCAGRPAGVVGCAHASWAACAAVPSHLPYSSQVTYPIVSQPTYPIDVSQPTYPIDVSQPTYPIDVSHSPNRPTL